MMKIEKKFCQKTKITRCPTNIKLLHAYYELLFNKKIEKNTETQQERKLWIW